MNLRPFIFVPILGLLVSCDALNEPVYYDSIGPAVENQQIQPAPIATTQLTAAQIPTYSIAPAVQPVKHVHQSPPSSPFMQPDVLGLPAKEDLKETSSTTPNSGNSGSLRVPSR